MFDAVAGWVTAKAAEIESGYSVNPWIFLGLMTACAPFFYYSIFRLAKGALKKDTRSLATWSTVFLAATALPYLYVLTFGRNLPWWVYAILAVLIAQGVWSLVRRLRGSSP